MATVRRFDRGGLQSAIRTPQGYLKAPAHATRTGVFVYRRADGSIVRELRHPDEVFRAESLRTLAGVPITNDHPTARVLTAENTREYLCGYTGDMVERDGEFVKTTVTVTDARVIEAIESGKQELSCGYDCELDESPGYWEGEPYDAIQRAIVYNHLAVVSEGRAGPQVKVHLDAADAVQVDSDNQNFKGANDMEKITIGGKVFDVSPDVAAAFRADQARLDAAKVEADKNEAALRSRADSAEAKADSYKAKLEKVEGDLAAATARLDSATDAKAQREMLKARKRLDAVAEAILDAETVAKLDDMSDLELKRAVIKAESPKINLDGKSDEYVNAAFDVIAEGLETRKDASEDLGAAINKNRKDGAETSDAEAARKRQREDAKNAWKAKQD